MAGKLCFGERYVIAECQQWLTKELIFSLFLRGSGVWGGGGGGGVWEEIDLFVQDMAKARLVATAKGQNFVSETIFWLPCQLRLIDYNRTRLTVQ